MFLRMWDGFWALFFLVSSEARLLCWFCKSRSARSLWDEVVEVERCHSPSSACSTWSPLNTASWGWSEKTRRKWHENNGARLAAGLPSRFELKGNQQSLFSLVCKCVSLRVKTGALSDSATQRALKSFMVKGLFTVRAKTNTIRQSPKVSWQEKKAKLFQSTQSTCCP